MKYISTGSTASQPQLAIADFIAGATTSPICGACAASTSAIAT
jgi:hypothetical protein